MYRDLTHGSITKGLLLFALPMIAGNLLQQLYNIADTLIVGQALGRNALAAVGSAYTLMVFLTSIFLGLSMGGRTVFHLPRPRRQKGAPGRRGPRLCPHRRRDAGAESERLSAGRSHSPLFADTARAVQLHAGLSADYFRRTGRHISL